MTNLKSTSQFLSIVLFSLIFAVVAGCSGTNGGTGDSANASGTGSVALLLTDAPSDIFEEVNITVVKAELLSDGGRVTLFQGERTFNLLDLTDARIFAIREGIPAGTYSKIRLTLTDIELVDYNDNDDPSDDKTYHPKLPGNGKLDLNPRGTFDVVPGGTLVIQIDMDANKSIHIVKRGRNDEYNFRPVVFIDIVTDAFQERFVKLHGNMFNIDSTNQSFDLCNTDIPVQVDDDHIKTGTRGCVHVETDSSTSIFDASGAPAGFGDLGDGEPATVFGRLQRVHHSDDDDDDDDHEMHDLVLKAALIELGPETGFQKLSGIATSSVDTTDQFTMDVDPGQGLLTPLNLTVQIQKGTLLINRKGQPVSATDIATGKLVSVRGVLDVDKKMLFASLIVVDTDSSTQLIGTVGANPDGVCGFNLVTTGGDRSISTDSNTRVFKITDGTSMPIDVTELSLNQPVDVYGEALSNGCFAAHTIIAF
ncbi:MAG: DUF4382 domain-containing protein [Thiotrichales bacterium]|nr:MAG: DUF4382 domain-containing protein [Thiotrichales bacterium]